MSAGRRGQAGLADRPRARRTTRTPTLIRGDLFMIAERHGDAPLRGRWPPPCAEALPEIDLIRSRATAPCATPPSLSPTPASTSAPRSGPAAPPAGTTVTAAPGRDDGRVALANVGDSRAPAAERAPCDAPDGGPLGGGRAGCDGPDLRLEASSHPQRNVVTRVLGAEAPRTGRHLLAGGAGTATWCCSGAATASPTWWRRRFAKLLAADKELRADRARPGAAALARGGRTTSPRCCSGSDSARRRMARAAATVLTRIRPGAGRRWGRNCSAPCASDRHDAGRGSRSWARAASTSCAGRTSSGPTSRAAMSPYQGFDRPVRRRQALPRGVGYHDRHARC